jgi:hypothetical protein
LSTCVLEMLCCSTALTLLLELCGEKQYRQDR